MAQFFIKIKDTSGEVEKTCLDELCETLNDVLPGGEWSVTDDALQNGSELSADAKGEIIEHIETALGDEWLDDDGKPLQLWVVLEAKDGGKSETFRNFTGYFYELYADGSLEDADDKLNALYKWLAENFSYDYYANWLQDHLDNPKELWGDLQNLGMIIYKTGFALLDGTLNAEKLPADEIEAMIENDALSNVIDFWRLKPQIDGWV